MENPLLVLAGHAAGWRTRPLPPDLERHARRALVDWFAALLAGASRPPATLLAAALADETRGGGGAVCYVTGRRVPLRHAALMNGLASHIVEFDDIYRYAVYHPGCPTIGAALAAAQARGADMAALLRAMVAGYEVSCRIGRAVQPSHYRFWHTTGTVGTFGAAAAVAVLLGCDAERTAHALATAATMASGLQQAFRGEGMSKPFHPGHAAEAGALAALAAAQGVTGALDVLHGPAGFAAATSEDTGKWEQALAGIGQPFAIADMTFKNHGCCGHIFAALDAIRALQRAHGFAAEEVDGVLVGGYRATKEICDRPEAATEQECRFSVQFTAATMLVHGGVRLAAYEPARIRDPAVRALMPRIRVEVDPECEAAFPARRSARVEIRLKDGRVLRHHQPTRKGDPDAPLSDEDLSEKFLELSVPAVGEQPARALLAQLWHGAALPGPVPLRGAAPAAAG
ncbi:MmgE/PrpD family protein [Caldovatus aquaticus]|uniref:MmgE/PrpD family protein n=1 Tax=Caldovatus aquaticus TaxID=2865671 RepID=A0ABS7F0M5_9PROT|nr:MmgE/PrpD family protein [Caldovatus aquaticus]MBW8269156.1 MmgE/PrpD family protein [Caldovatus aquaticus]